MDNTEDQNDTTSVIPAESEISFIIDEKKHNLSKAHKAIDKEVLNAIEFLGSIVSDTDKPVDVRMKAAEKIIDSKLKISQQQNTEFLQRLVQEARKNMLKVSTSGIKRLKNSEQEDGEDDSQIPIYRPDVILDVSDKSSL